MEFSAVFCSHLNVILINAAAEFLPATFLLQTACDNSNRRIAVVGGWVGAFEQTRKGKDSFGSSSSDA